MNRISNIITYEKICDVKKQRHAFNEYYIDAGNNKDKNRALHTVCHIITRLLMTCIKVNRVPNTVVTQYGGGRVGAFPVAFPNPFSTGHRAWLPAHPATPASMD